MLVVFYFFTFYSRLAFFVYPQSAHFIIRCSLFSFRSTSPLLQRKVSLVKASRRDFLKKDYKKVHYFLIPQSVRVAHSQLLTGARPLCHFVTFPHTVGNHPFQGSLNNPPVCSRCSQPAPDGSPSPLSLRDISPHCGESPFTREPITIRVLCLVNKTH